MSIPMSITKIVSVTTACPFCGGGTSLLEEPEGVSMIDLVERFVGTRIRCQHPGCDRMFFVRRGDLKIRRAEA